MFVVMHSVYKGRGPGNYVLDSTTGQIALAPGTAIRLGDRTYTTSRSQIIGKKDLPYQAGIWANTPRRLVLITCIQTTSGRSDSNAVISATLA